MRDKAKYLLIIDSGGARQALMLSADRAVVADFDASVEEVALMTQGLSPRTGASHKAWDKVLAGHSAKERAECEVYTLDV